MECTHSSPPTHRAVQRGARARVIARAINVLQDEVVVGGATIRPQDEEHEEEAAEDEDAGRLDERAARHPRHGHLQRKAR